MNFFFKSLKQFCNPSSPVILSGVPSGRRRGGAESKIPVERSLGALFEATGFFDSVSSATFAHADTPLRMTAIFGAGVCQRALRILFMLLCDAALRAEEQTTCVRVIGISDPSRVEDFRKTVKSVSELQLVSVDGDKATAVLRYEVSAIVTKPKPKPDDLAPAKILAEIDNLIGKACVRTFSITEPTGVAEDKLTKVECKVGVLDCKGCRYGAYIAIAKLDGVERAIVDSITRTLTAWIDPAKTNKEALEAALKKAHVELPGS